MSSEPSEFGAGIVVCLAKFGEHLQDRQYNRVSDAIWWQNASEENHARQEQEAARFPHGDAARRLSNVKSVFGFSKDSPEAAISDAIEMWMNAASDHMYEIDRDIAPPSLIDLADLTLRVGHGFTGTRWTKETVDTIRRLWKQACIEVDARLGTQPDWGTW